MPLPVAPRSSDDHGELSLLRRHQRRLLYGGGWLLSLLVLTAVLAFIMQAVAEFRWMQWRALMDTQATVNTFMVQRERGVMRSLLTNDILWSKRREHLINVGSAPAEAFVKHGRRWLVQVAPLAVPWLTIGRDASAPSGDLLKAYMGLVYESSSFASATVQERNQLGSLTVYGYDASEMFFTMTHPLIEEELLRSLQVTSREQALARLVIPQSLIDELRRLPQSFASGQSGQLLSFFGRNPFDGEPSLAGIMTSAIDGHMWFRFVVFDRIAVLQGFLDAGQRQVIETHKGERVIATEAFDRSDGRIGVLRNPRLRTSWGKHDWGSYANGRFAIAAPIMGVNWAIIQTYGWSDVITAAWRETNVALIAAIAGLLVLWIMLLRLDRLVFAPAIERALRVYESDMLNRAIIATSPVGLCLLDPRTREPIIQSQIMATYATEGAQADSSLYERLLTACEHVGGSFQMTLGTAPGERKLHAVASRLSFRQPAWLITLRDVTAQALTEQALRNASDAAEEAKHAAEAANQAKSAFVAMISHEIRTPLNGLMGHLELLSHTTLDECQRSHVERLSQSATTLLSLVSGVLDFSRIESGLMTLDPVWFNLRELAEEAALLFGPEASGKGLHVHIALDPALKESYYADMGRIRQVLHNLMNNAVKFTDSGWITLRVFALDASMLRFEVVDSGIGMTADQLSHIFEPFMQADQSISRRFGGSGLGLALCRQIANLLGGELSAQSTPGVGSLFRLDVPVPQAMTAFERGRPLAGACYVPAATLQTHQQGAARQARNGHRLLVVEDHLVNRELISQQLDALGYDVVTAESGLAAIERWSEAAYAAVITDINMPGMNGYELAQWLRERDPQIPILAASASSLASERSECERVGMTRLLLKPLSLDHLRQALSELVLRPVTKPRAMSERLRQSFVLAGREDVRILREAVRDNDTDTLRDRLHAMKGVLVLVGHPDVARDIADLENLLSDTTAASIWQEVETLAARVEDIIDAMESPGNG